MKYLATAFILLFVFLVSVVPATDMDLGWHLRYGEYFFKTGHVLKDNILSFAWPEYKWVQASWGYDLLLYQLFTHFGFFGLAVTCGLSTVIIFFLLTYPQKRFSVQQLLFLSIIFVSSGTLLFSAGLRAQTISAIFFTLSLIIGYRITHQSRSNFAILLPLLFFLWTNIHGGFALGLIVLALIWFIYGILLCIQTLLKRPFKSLSIGIWIGFGIGLACSFLAALANPWGIRIYDEIAKHVTNKNLTYVGEWMPLSRAPIETVIGGFVVIAVLCLAIYRKKIQDIPYLLTFLFISYLSMNAIRFTIPFSLMATYYMAQNLPHLHIPLARYTGLLVTIVLIACIGTDLVVTHRYIGFPNPELLTFSWKDYCMYRPCSEEITQIMLQNPPIGNGYTTGSYGSYMIWRVPHVKTFIDGRMAAWEKNGATPPVVTDTVPTESVPTSWRLFDSQYHFTWTILPTMAPNTRYLDSLVANGLWVLVYKDNHWSYYVKK